jgi:hypothetical protein
VVCNNNKCPVYAKQIFLLFSESTDKRRALRPSWDRNADRDRWFFALVLYCNHCVWCVQYSTTSTVLTVLFVERVRVDLVPTTTLQLCTSQPEEQQNGHHFLSILCCRRGTRYDKRVKARYACPGSNDFFGPVSFGQQFPR